MVFGPLLDYQRARREGKSITQVWGQGQQLVNTSLPFGVKIAFWLTNVPYFLLSALLSAGAEPLIPGGRLTHALAVTCVAIASTAFHGSALFLSPTSPWPSRLLVGDLLFANGYAIGLATRVGLSRMLYTFGVAVVFLATSARLKRRGSAVGYALGHGIWHVLSAAAMWHCLFVAAR